MPASARCPVCAPGAQHLRQHDHAVRAVFAQRTIERRGVEL